MLVLRNGRYRFQLLDWILTALLIATIAVLLPPALRSWSASPESSPTELLRDGLPNSTEIGNLISMELTPEDFAGFLAAFTDGELADTPKWRFGALLIGFLRLHNVPMWEESVALSYSTQTRMRIRTEENDTWSSLASRHYGNEDLWPLLMMLNFDWVQTEGVSVDHDWIIQVPLDAKKNY